MEIPDLILSRLVYGASFRKLMGIEYGRAEEYLFRKKKKKNKFYRSLHVKIFIWLSKAVESIQRYVERLLGFVFFNCSENEMDAFQPQTFFSPLILHVTNS